MDLKAIAQSAYASVDARCRELSRWLKEHPEVSLEERRASARIADLMEDLGWRVERGVYGEQYGVAARLGSRGPEVVICAEYDALPSIGHACGHNIIAAAAVGAGAGLAPVVDELGVRVTVLGTPAEEHIGAKVNMIEAGAFDDAAAAMMIHPSTQDVVDPTIIAISHLDVSFHGKAAHASAHPQLGVNALDAFVQAYVNIATLRQALYPTDKIHGVLNHGGEAPNIIPEYTHSSWYVRAADRDRLDEVVTRFRAAFEAAAVATGCVVDFEQVGNTLDELESNPVLVELFAANSRELGRPMRRGHQLPEDQTGSTDMGNVSRVVPTIHPMLDIGCYPIVNHQREFAEHTVSPQGEQAIRDGAVAMAWTVIDLAMGDHWNEL